ncbi:MAG: MotA/TolQ/ExbB proton channel family protein [Cyclobacteriaceae bacterium]
MKKLFALLTLIGVLTFGFSANILAQEDTAAADTDTAAAETDTAAVAADTTAMADEDMDEEAEEDVLAEEDPSFHQVIKSKFIEGQPEWMIWPLLCLILGLAVAIERIITLNLATTNTNKLLAKVENALSTDGVEGAKEVTKNTRGPVASIFTQGLMRMGEGIEMVEKSIISYGSVEMGRLERGLVWISLFISLAPMLGFMGTVVGMIAAFDNIQAQNDISPAIVAGGISVALLTTLAGLIVAVILQIFYNYCVSKIDSLVNQMEDASISLVDMLVKHNLTKSK